MSSQYGEHLFIAQHFAGRVGRFLDIGAFDGKTFSNTWHLSQAGWSGVCVEPNPPAFCHLMRNYEGNPRLTLVNAAVAFTGERIRRFDANTVDAFSADMMSTLDRRHAETFSGYPYREIWIPTVTPSELRSALPGGCFEFLNVDVEGLNLPVFRAALEVFTSEMICVEIDPEEALEEFCNLARSAGYGCTKRIGGNLLAWRQC
jgi:FkbM family methyltransferase